MEYTKFRYNPLVLTSIIARVTKEFSHYRDLPDNSRNLLLASYLYYLAYPLLTIFVNAYLWRHAATVDALIMFNATACLGIVIGFYLNVPLLRRFHVTRLYSLGLFLQAFALLFIVASSELSIPIWLYGLIAGLGGGFFWSNKNYLSIIHSRGAHRLYYNGLEFAGLQIIRVGVPLITGGIFALGASTSLYSPTSAYRLIMLIAMVGLFLSGYLLAHAHLPDVEAEQAVLSHPSARWWRVRLYNFLNNTLDGFEYVLPTVLIFTLIGEEGALGLITSLSTLLSAVVLYYFGRKSNLSRVWGMTTIGNLAFAVGAIILYFTLSPLAALIFLATSTISKALRFSPPYTISMEIMDEEGRGGQYAYLCDSELAYNLGRFAGLGLVGYLASFSDLILLQFAPIAMIPFAILSLIPLRSMVKSISR